ncbi:HNH endonuclease [Paenibacillus sp. FSL H7-0323]|uniref:HNH endonuclease n=1 Tax=Paenibacillus sp. FSL H7-0323 TaxID=2921433 RepID=UPI0030F559D6
MALIHKIEAAVKIGISMELLKSFVSKCPKPGQTVRLRTHIMADGAELIDTDELQNFRVYLNQPWPRPPSGGRPNIPTSIIKDIKEESSYTCAICGHLQNGEVAHIEAVADTYNNSPENLILLCPNHHSAYDYGYKIGNNVTLEEVRAAKMLKRKNRRRMMRQEENLTQTVAATLKIIKELHEKVTADPGALNEIVVTEAENFLKKLPEFMDKAQEQARKDQPVDGIDKVILNNMPAISKLIQGVYAKTDKREISQMIANVAKKTNDIIIEIDEVICPRCHGRGLTGLVGDFCAYCRGSCYVTTKQATEYNPGLIDEVECPHCKGKGQTGLVGDLCRYCGGSCVVTEEKAEEYDPNDFDDVECPRCHGKGTYGWNGDICLYCKGSQSVSKELAAEYDEDEFDQQNCPHCGGNGTLGHNSTPCGYCSGSCLVTSEDVERYDPDLVDQVICPRCAGNGTIGWGNSVCSYCNGDTVVTRQEYEEFNQDELDEVECPHCHGRGTVGYNGDGCKLCHGDMVVSLATREAYLKRYGDR